MTEDIYIFSQYINKNRPANVLMAGISYCDSSYFIKRSDYDSYVIEYTIDGQGVFEADGQKYDINPGDTYFIYKGKPHKYYCVGNTWTKIWVVLQGELADALFGSYLKKQESVLRGLNIHELMQKIISIACDKNISYDKMVDQIMINIHKILISAQDYYLPLSHSHTLSESVKNYIDNNLYTPLNLDDIAASLHYSKNHIINIFRNEYGSTPYVYYKKQKMLISGDLLTQSPATISDISAKLGFENPQHFSKSFKNYFGITPSQFRKKSDLFS